MQRANRADFSWTSREGPDWPRISLLAVILVVSLAFVLISLRIHGVPLWLYAVMIPVVAVFCLFVALTQFEFFPRSLGLNERGILLDITYTTIAAEWAYVYPNFLVQRSLGLMLHVGGPGRRAFVRSVWLSNQQARALLAHPAAPKWPMSAEARQRWGPESAPQSPMSRGSH